MCRDRLSEEMDFIIRRIGRNYKFESIRTRKLYSRRGVAILSLG